MPSRSIEIELHPYFEPCVLMELGELAEQAIQVPIEEAPAEEVEDDQPTEAQVLADAVLRLLQDQREELQKLRTTMERMMKIMAGED